MNFDMSHAIDSIQDGTKEVAEVAHTKTSEFHETYVSKVVPDCGKYGDAAKFVAEMAPGVAEYNAIREGDWQSFAISAGIDVVSLAAGAVTLGAGYGAVKGGSVAAKAGVKVASREIAEAGAKKAVKEVAEAGTKKAVKEVAEAGAEKAAKEIAEAGAEKAAKEIAEAGAEKAAKEVAEEGTEKAVKEAAEKTAKEATEEGVENISKKTIYSTNEWKGPGKQDYLWNDYKLEGDTVVKYKCHRFKTFDGDEDYWVKTEKFIEQWKINDPNLPDWLHKYI